MHLSQAAQVNKLHDMIITAPSEKKRREQPLKLHSRFYMDIGVQIERNVTIVAKLPCIPCLPLFTPVTSVPIFRLMRQKYPLNNKPKLIFLPDSLL